MSPPPSGTITFLFTDIEGSTQLWEHYPSAMRPALARHDLILRSSIEGHEGSVFKTIGDAFCAAFATAQQALEAALAAQLALRAEPWETATPIRVRMALHTGSAEERGGDYFGPPLNRVARLLATGHGGQTLLSEAAQALTRDALPPGVSLQDLGPHRLKDLGRPEQVYQLQHSLLPSQFPPLRSLDNPALPNNLPQQVTSFIGRTTQIAEIKALLQKTRLLTLTGGGGNGKTRLSLQVAADLLDGEGDGVWLVELAALTDPALVPQAVADVLSVREEPGRALSQTLTDWLKPKRLLIVLDNCEHLVSACASLTADLLRACPGVHLLASSREALNVPGEQTYRVPSLSLPDPKQVQTVAALSQYEAVSLFIERAQAVQPAFAVTTANAPAVAQVCCRLDGIPLALELAAARVRSLPIEEINTRLDHRFRLLTGGSRTALPRQQTLRALVDWSYDLLTDSEKTTLRRLSVFAGGWTLDAAEVICSGDAVENFEVLDLVTGLADKSLAVYEDASGTGRFRLLETVREYASDRLTESGEAAAVREKAAAWFLNFAVEAYPHLLGPEQAVWIARLEAEHDNVRASLAYYDQAADGGAASLRLASTLCFFWFQHDYLSEGLRWLNRALERTQGQEDLEGIAMLRAKAFNGAGTLAGRQGSYAAAQALYEESLTLWRQLGNESGTAKALSNLGSTLQYAGDTAAARAAIEEGLTILRRLGDDYSIAAALGNLGNVAYRQADFAEAGALQEESLAIRRRLGDSWGVANTLSNLGAIEIGRGNYEAAWLRHREGLRVVQPLGDLNLEVAGLEGLAQASFGRDRPAEAVRLLAAAALLRETVAAVPIHPMDQAELDGYTASAHAALGEEAYAAAWATGQAMSWEQAVDYALALEEE